MFGGDNLSVVLFLWGLAVTVGVAAMDAAGWKHRYLIQSLFALAILLALAGVVWVPVKEIIKDGTVAASIAGTLTVLAGSWWAWLVIVVVLGGTISRYSQGTGRPLPFLPAVTGP